MERESRRLRRALGWVVRIGLSLACLWLVLRQVDLAAALALTGRIGLPLLVAVAILHAAIVALTTGRWRLVVAGMGGMLPYRTALGLNLFGTLLNLILPSGVGGDAGRALLGYRHGMAAPVAVGSVLIDRLSGLQGLGVLALIGAVLGGAAAVDPLVLLAILATVPAVALAFWMGLPQQLAALRGGLRSFLAAVFRPQAPGERRSRLVRPLLAVALSVPAHAIAVAILLLFLAALGQHVPVVDGMVIFPGVLLAAALPVSVGGWGVRELAAVELLGRVGVDGGAAASTTIAFALSQMAVAFVGTLVWLAFGRRSSRDVVTKGF